MIASYTHSYQQAGIKATAREIEQLVVSDLQLVDTARATGELAGPGRATKRDRKPGRVRPNVIAAAERDTGTHLQASTGKAVKSRALHMDPRLVSDRWAHAVQRIGDILSRTAHASTLEGAIAGAEFSALAREYAELWSYYMTRDRPARIGLDHNPFRGMSPADASRAFMARVESLCDKSTGALGPWWVR